MKQIAVRNNLTCLLIIKHLVSEPLQLKEDDPPHAMRRWTAGSRRAADGMIVLAENWQHVSSTLNAF